MNKKYENKIDDFYVGPTFSYENSLFNSDNLSKYCEYTEKLPAKLKEDPSFNKWDFYNEIIQNKSLYRKNETANDSIALYWLSQVRKMANIFSMTNDIPKLSLTEEDLRDLAHKSVDESYIPHIADYLLQKGIILIYIKNIEGMKVDGVSFLLDGNIPVIGMSLRYSRIDYYWFTLFHELAHIILHKEFLTEPLLDDLDEESCEDIEIEADTLAKDSFIPISSWRTSKLNYSSDYETLIIEAKKFKLHPAILAGRYRRENHKYNIFTSVVQSCDIRKNLLCETTHLF